MAGGDGVQLLRVQWARRDRGLMDGAQVRVSWRGGSTCHVGTCHHARPEDAVHDAVIVASGVTDAALCSTCMRHVLPAPPHRLLEAARPGWEGLGATAGAALLAHLVVPHALALVGDAQSRLDVRMVGVVAEQFGSVRRRLADIETEVARQARCAEWRDRVDAAALARVLAVWFDGHAGDWPPAAVAFMDEHAPRAYDSPAVSERLRAIADNLLIGEPSGQLVVLAEALLGHDLARPWADGPDRRRPDDPLDELAQWGLVAEAEAQLAEVGAVADEFRATLGTARCDLVAPRPEPVEPGGGRLVLGHPPNWLWLAVLAGVAGADVSVGRGSSWDAATVSPFLRLALIGSGPGDPHDVRAPAAVDQTA